LNDQIKTGLIASTKSNCGSGTSEDSGEGRETGIMLRLEQLDPCIMIPLESKRPGELTAKKITSLSRTTLKREHKDKVKRISKGRWAISIGDVLKITAGK
jgi:hypothetical protein